MQDFAAIAAYQKFLYHLGSSMGRESFPMQETKGSKAIFYE
jgi:hypothetical protein